VERYGNGTNEYVAETAAEAAGLTRRRFLTRMASGVLVSTTAAAAAAFFDTPGAFADELVRTPRQTEGPFYPDRLPLDGDNDLIVVNSSVTPAVGAITQLTGRVLDARGTPVKDATVEIWQVDNYGNYIHSRGANYAAGGKRDSHFQGYGKFVTGSTGEYRFRTIKPVPYPGRTPHIHMAVRIKGQPTFTTQCYVKGEPQNDRDGVLNGIRDPKQRASVIVPFAPVKDSRIGELAARMDIVLGYTPTV